MFTVDFLDILPYVDFLIILPCVDFPTILPCVDFRIILPCADFLIILPYVDFLIILPSGVAKNFHHATTHFGTTQKLIRTGHSNRSFESSVVIRNVF